MPVHFLLIESSICCLIVAALVVITGRLTSNMLASQDMLVLVSLCVLWTELFTPSGILFLHKTVRHFIQ